jgi:hypothetical protein
MKKSRFTGSQIIAVLKQAEGGTPVPELFGGMEVSMESVRRLPSRLSQSREPLDRK